MQINLHTFRIVSSFLVLCLAACSGLSDDAYNLNYESSSLHVDFSDNTYSDAKKVVIQRRGTSDEPAVFTLERKSRTGFAYTVSDSEVRGKFIEGKIRESTLCGDVQLYQLTLTYSQGGTSTTLKGSPVPCEG